MADDPDSAALGATWDELEELAGQRAAATGHVVIVAAFTGSDQARSWTPTSPPVGSPPTTDWCR